MKATLLTLGHDVVSAVDRDPRATDEEILALALGEGRVLVTEDKDFGELVFVRRLPHPCIIRFSDMPVAAKVSSMRYLIEQHADSMREGVMIVVTRNRLRIRRGAPGEVGA